ncbi:MAG: penicillin-binding protein, partial [Anaerolineales bacterium]|nr:penicillin-binding protein [Anaerolineales bacterium]
MLILAALFHGDFTYLYLTNDLPSVEALPAYLDCENGLLLHPTRLYDRDGTTLLAVLAPTHTLRRFLALEEISPLLIQATLALEQPDFWDSPGYRLQGWRDPESHPTLAQQLAFTFLLAEEPPSLRRALRERLLAAQLTAHYGRAQILEWYLNSADYGHLAYGVEAASRFYLGKSAKELTLSEAALLAAIGHEPTLDPFTNPQSAETARIEALRALLSLGWITPEQARQAVNDPPRLASPSPSPYPTDPTIAPAFLDYLLTQIRRTSQGNLAIRGGMVIHTTLEYNLQRQADCLLRTQQARLRGAPSPVQAADGADCLASVFLPPIEPGGNSSSGGLLVLNPRTGEILAAAGDLSPQPAGWSLTPWLYLTAFVRGLSPANLIWDLPEDAPALGQVYQGPIRLRTALLTDALVPARTLLRQIGNKSVQQTAASFGLDLPGEGQLLEQDFSLSPFRLASAFGVFANQGIQVGLPAEEAVLEAAAILRISRLDGLVWEHWKSPSSRPLLSPQLAYLMTHVLRESPETKLLDHPAASKTAFSLDGSGIWVIGYTLERVALVHLTGSGTGLRGAAQGLWAALLEYASYGLERRDWPRPAGVVSVKVCDPSGLLPTPACPRVVEEVFLEGRQPVEYDSLYQTYDINIETGLLATVFTPSELVRTRVYLALPPAALDWARQAGFELPPTTYDAYQPVSPPEQARITMPAMFTLTGGMIDVRGVAAGEDFVSYRLEYGRGLNPKTWILLHEGTTSVENGLLGRWNTAGLDGVYTLRLLVLRKGNRLDQALTQLTLDNTPPQVEILYPHAGQIINQAREPQLAFQAQAVDAFLAEVNFYLDGQLLTKTESAPFGFIWTVTPGEHLLRVTAVDRAGNLGEAQIRFTVK